TKATSRRSIGPPERCETSRRAPRCRASRSPGLSRTSCRPAASRRSCATRDIWSADDDDARDTEMTTSVTQQLAEWISGASYDDIPPVGVARVRERFLDSLGVQFGGMSVSTGQILAKWIKAQEAKPESTVVGAGFKTTCSLAALANASAGHALEFDDIATFGGHYANPLTASTLALGEKLESTGRDAILAWMVGWEVIAQTSKLCLGPRGNELLY